MKHIAFPHHLGINGRTALADEDHYIRGLIEQVLFTAPGERVNRPTFGSGLLQLIFAPINDALAGTVQMTVQGALQQWLGDLIQVEAVRVETEDTQIKVTVQYVLRRNLRRDIATFERKV